MLRILTLSFILVAHALTQSSAFRLYDVRAHVVGQKAALVSKGFDSSYKLSLPHPVQDKNFYLLSLLQRDPAVRRLLVRNKALSEVSSHKQIALRQAANCNDVACFDKALRFDGPTIEAVGNTFKALAGMPEFRSVVRRHMRPSGVFIKYQDQSDAQMLVSAWKDAASGLNRILSVYGLGNDPKYKDIDRVSFDVSKESYRDLLRAKAKEVSQAKATLFFEPTLNFALGLLAINRRDEAARYEPLENGENKAAVQHLRKINWSDYPYPYILVLGSGTRDLTTRLSPIGAKRTDVAAQLFQQRKAPLVIVSGGHVHPMQTPYCEAIEMKKYLMEKYKIPETGILIEPHARHTTTNFRNGVRLAFRYGIPTNKKALVTSSEDHITYTVGDEFRKRCLEEFGYFPVESIKQVSPAEAEFLPSVMSLFFDANDPLDP
jgi:hypothetical protein